MSPIIFKKASRKWLRQTPQNFYSQAKNIANLSKDQVKSGKALHSFENYLCVVSMMYYGDPLSSTSRSEENFCIGKRSRSKNISDPLSMIFSPLRAEFEFGIFYIESWSPKQIAIFECSFCSFGKSFHVIYNLLNRKKSLNCITKFYYMWKKTSHYKIWKDTARDQFLSKKL